MANTPNLLPVLAQAGKVDSGGKGLFFILEGIYRRLTGIGVDEGCAPAAPAAAREPAAPRPVERPIASFRPWSTASTCSSWSKAQRSTLQAIREQITAMGDCPLVEGDETLVKVHVHVPNPGVPLSYAVSLGFVTDVVVENMDDMHHSRYAAGL